MVRLGELMMILELHRQGVSITAIARRTGRDPKTVRKYIANVRVHGTTQRIVAEAFDAEQPELQTLPEHRFDAVLKLERRVSHDGFVAVGGNYYSVPDRTRRVVEV